MGSKALDLRVYRKGTRVAELRAEADPKDTQELRKLLLDAVRRDRKRDDQIGEYKMEVQFTGDARLVTTFVATAD
jgi:hypothetical protein